MNKKQILTATLTVNIANMLLFSSALAGNAGGGGGSGGNAGCMEPGWTLSTCYGATWQYYKIGSDPTADASNPDSIKVLGKGTYAPAGTITGCAAAGGYYRYAMVAHGNGSGYSSGQQVGIGSIGYGGATIDYVSEYFGGGMNYIGSNWDSVKSAFETAQSSPNFHSNGYTWSSSSGLGWFCYDQDNPGGDTPTPPPPPPATNYCSQHTPSSYSSSGIGSGTTSTLSAVKNTSNPKYTSWNELVYAKPTDSVQFIHCYYPGAQRVKKSSSHGAHNSNGSSSSNGARDKFVATSNNFSVEQFNFYGSKSESYSIGDDTIREWQSSNHTVETSKAGDTIDQTSKGQNGSASSWFVDDSWTYYVYEQNGSYCGYEVGPNDANGNPTQGPAKSCNVPHTAHHSSPTDYYDGSASGTASDTATVIVPYNFTNTAEASFTTNSNNGVVFAGETASAQISINVNTRWNNTTSVDREYATRVDSAKYSIIAYTTNSPNKAGSSNYGSGKNADLCGYFTNKTHGNCNVLKSEDNQTLNSGESMSGSTNEVKLYNDSYRIYDAPAGEYYCIAAAVYPANSGADTSTSASGSNSWYISNSTCKAIAKRPVFQIWGGGFYSAGNVSTATTSKGHIVGYYGYSAIGGSNALFSSWSELAVASNGVVSNLASGAATSYTYTNKNAYNYVSNFARDNCQRARLSFANSICSGGTTGSSGIAADYSIKNTIISRYATEDKYISNIVTVAGKTIPQKTVEVTYASGVNITGDILYEETAYVSASQVPQYIIYSKGNINIDCNVNRIDAWLIADGTINTCSSAANATVTNGLIDDASGIRSRQLKINGVIIADQLILGRTYGAATGSNSGTPAEIINLSGASYIWAENTASDTPKLYTTYLRELAPRY